jgi:hypothetical protein
MDRRTMLGGLAMAGLWSGARPLARAGSDEKRSLRVAFLTEYVRLGGRATSLSYGRATSELANLMASADRLDREKRRFDRMRVWAEKRQQSEERQEARRTANQELQALRERLDSTDRLLAESSRWVGRAISRRSLKGNTKYSTIAATFTRRAHGRWLGSSVSS